MAMVCTFPFPPFGPILAYSGVQGMSKAVP